jgi:hypothetical protein
MQIIMTEEQWNTIFIDTCKQYRGIIESIYLKTIAKANNKPFAKNYFLQSLESELEFYKGYAFNETVVGYFQIYYNLGFSWAKFFKEVRVLQKIYTYDATNTTLNDFAKLCSEFTPQEVKRIALESKMLQGSQEETTIYDIVTYNLLTKKRDIDFVKYVAKYKAMCAFVQELRNTYECNDVNNTNIIRASNESIRWNGAKGKKIELIRLLVALNDCKYFETSDGLVPNQEQLMNYFGEMLSVNLKHYEQDLSNGFESKLQTNTAVFDKLKSAIEKRCNQKVAQN